jgi:hypothetical protein
MISWRKLLFLVIGMGIFLAGARAQGPSKARILAGEAARVMDNIVTLSCKMKRWERFKHGAEEGECRMKVNINPLKLYFYSIAPEEGAEILWAKGWNDEKVYVHPNKFPWVNVSLGVNASNFTSRQHHSILLAGFSFINSVLKHFMTLFKDDFDQRFKYIGKEKWYGKMLDVVKIIHPDYRFVDYTVKAGEDLGKLETKLKIPAYKILEINPTLADYFDVKAGQVIKIPNYYAKEMVMMIDPDNHLPVVQVIFDEKGLFEKYEYSDVKINVPFSTMEFSEDFEGYHF